MMSHMLKFYGLPISQDKISNSLQQYAFIFDYVGFLTLHWPLCYSSNSKRMCPANSEPLCRCFFLCAYLISFVYKPLLNLSFGKEVYSDSAI